MKPNFDASTDQTLESTKVGTVKPIDTLMIVFTFLYEGLLMTALVATSEFEITLAAVVAQQ